MDLNKVSLIGNLTKDPIARKTAKGADVVRFTLAATHVYKEYKSKERKETTEFITIVAWGKLAGIVSQYLKKGSRIYLEGRLETRIWEDDKKFKHYKTEIIARDMIMLGGGLAKKEQGEEELAAEDIEIEEVPLEED